MGKICTSLAKLGTQTRILYNKIFAACSASLHMLLYKLKAVCKSSPHIGKIGHMSLPTAGNMHAAKIS